ncbi:MAG: serine protease [Hyphomicrobiales bacterium]|nr:serine protease [Hyphomicrobiales bacterium]MCP5373377.1 serine protease [Hyphomicrobiales bacterium]
MPRRLAVLVLVLACAAALPAADLWAQQATTPTNEVLRAVVGVRAEVPMGSRTARTLGMEREGSGVVIDGRGLVLTIGYLIMEADTVEIVLAGDRRVPAAILAYDHNSGFGLVRAREDLGVPAMALGESAGLREGDRGLAVSLDGMRPVTPVRVVSRRPFAGYWEYLLEDAIFTAPPHLHFGGAALVGEDGRLLGIGSLFVNDAAQGEQPVMGNMFVPVDDLKPILADMLKRGRSHGPVRPWLGLQPQEVKGRVFVGRVVQGGPADNAGIQRGDVILGVNGRRVADMADYFRKVWALGDAGTDIPLDLVSVETETLEVRKVSVQSEDRYDWLDIQVEKDFVK